LTRFFGAVKLKPVKAADSSILRSRVEMMTETGNHRDLIRTAIET
jgi:hypothetical protein